MSIRMAQFMSQYVVTIAIALVALVLVLGLFNMLRGGSPNTSQKGIVSVRVPAGSVAATFRPSAWV